jgi:3-deoxy-D-manno-octulosonic-acid transferase
MVALEGFLHERGLPALFRSKTEDAELPSSIACLVLDTIGELKDFYAASRIAHVGVDHNVLEPLGFGKPVTVQPGWNDTYPSYPVYCLLREQGGLIEVATAEELAAAWSQLLLGRDSYRSAQQQVRMALETVRGSVERHWIVMAPLLAEMR